MSGSTCACYQGETYDFWILSGGTVLPDETVYTLFNEDSPAFQGARIVSVPAEIVHYMQGVSVIPHS